MKRKIAKKHFFVQDTGIFGDEFMVIVGMGADEALAKCKKKSIKKHCVDLLEKFKEAFVKEEAFFLYRVEDDQPIALAMPKGYDDTWNFWELLLHELEHVRQAITKRKELRGEDEAEAYLIQYLFRSIRRKIQGVKE